MNTTNIVIAFAVFFSIFYISSKSKSNYDDDDDDKYWIKLYDESTNKRVTFEQAKRKSKIDKDKKFSLYSQGGDLVLKNADFKTIKKNIDKYY